MVKKKTKITVAKKRPQGAQTKFDDSLVPVIKKLFLVGKTNLEVAWMLDICEKTLYNWCQKNTELLLAIKESKKSATDQVENAVFQSALGYVGKETKVFITKDGKIKTKTILKEYAPNVPAGQYFLNNRDPEKWKTKVEHAIDPESVKEFTLNYKLGDSKKKKK